MIKIITNIIFNCIERFVYLCKHDMIVINILSAVAYDVPVAVSVLFP